MSRFDDQVVVITGGAKGQGRSHAVAFAELGADVVICDIAAQIPCASAMGTIDDLNHTRDLVEATGRRCVAVQADTRDAAAMRDLVGKTIAEFGRIDVFIANAGIAAFGPIATMPDDMWFDVVDVNLNGVANAIRAVVPHMIERERGRIIATASIVGREGGPNNANYAASKWGVIGLVKSLAIELAPHGVTINALSPMSVSTDMCHNDKTYTLFRPDLAAPTTDDVRDTFAGLNPMRVPWLELEDSTNSVVFLASDEARYITGTSLDVAGGWNANHCA
ncbi:MAG: putative short-chain dehydrogenase/reductase [Acidimicrobiales bacterium]|nr:MAG: putative short-chain dehydrogenase/reductase [Acidimicrobiales bacterium]